ncbi:hypothetical protein GUITHDRAFT_108208 [Guillardia theta CCMP2712]|uniref:NADH:ubiquinone oxidoreductase intermediate-associated protein 30 domain-containing protein n=1 Tax=Guillardia theta (strain CCMP2712) TaxID=905079 RepID=L1JB43_GUITC|nr:hypothetical protein GUITHDRAFT_108208 [Guillardia theta CCMP2712]EKX45751.1 hypothetical protein GUITHDRAFT_108208 [Guillardia theta CCMP2712]|eukprot:XP_005832731.1 hypothetical protein GUITHDRAFT_108208 [Guillardia theta CCMP2712]
MQITLFLVQFFISSSAAASTPTSFAKWFEGKWEVQIITTHSDGRVEDAPKNGQYVMRNEESRLVGTYFENVTTTSEITNPMRVRVEIDSEFKGVFRTARSTVDLFSAPESEEPELKFKTLFEFDFKVNGSVEPRAVVDSAHSSTRMGITFRPEVGMGGRKEFLDYVTKYIRIDRDAVGRWGAQFWNTDNHGYGPTFLIFFAFIEVIDLEQANGRKE